MYLRRWLRETPIFVELQARKALARELPLKSVVVRHKKAVAVSMLLTWLLSAGIVVVIVVVILMAPLLLQANCVAIIALAFGCIVAGVVIDRFGARKTFVVGCALLAVGSGIFYHSDVANRVQLFLTYGTAGFFVGIMGGVPFDGPRLSGAGAVQRHFLFLQYFLRHFRWSDANGGDLTDESDADGAVVVCAGVGADGHCAGICTTGEGAGRAAAHRSG